ncbi:MAG: ABC transporter permease [Candidatus Nanopelagicales bacterium]
MSRSYDGRPGSSAPPAAWRQVAAREFTERARERSFYVSTLITLGVLAAVLLLPKLFASGPTTIAFTGPDAARVQAAATAGAAAAGVELEVVDPPADVRAAVADGQVDVVVDGQRLVVQREVDPGVQAVLESAVRQATVTQRLAAAGLTPQQVSEALTTAPLTIDALDPQDAEAQQRQGFAFAASVILYGQLLGYGFWVASGVVEEKASRVVEVLLATNRPRQLLLGKVLGIGALGLLQLVALAVVGLGLAVALGSLTWSAGLGVAILTSFAWFLLGFTFYAAGYAAGAARVSRQEDLQNVVTPLNLMAIASFFGSIVAINAGDSFWVQVFSVIPPFSALMQPSLIAAGDSSPAVVALAVVLMLAAIAGMVLLAARVYERSVLRIGAPLSLRESLRD